MPPLHRELEAVEELHDRFGFTYAEIASAVNTRESSLHRWRLNDGAPPTPVYLARLAAIDAFLTELRRTFRRKKDAADWVDKRVPAFGNRTAREMILAGPVARVTGALYAINAGVSI